MRHLQFWGLLCLVMCTSCVWDETLEEISRTEPDLGWVASIPASRASDNVLIIEGNNGSYQEMDWKDDSDSEFKSLADKHEDADIYAYNGSGGSFVNMDGVPGILYTQTGKWSDTGFQYAMNKGGEDAGVAQESFKDAFASVVFNIKNNDPSLHLQVTGIKLCQVAADGTFLFPVQGMARWVTEDSQGILAQETDTLDVKGGEVVSLPAEGGFPVIPQKRKGWKPYELPNETAGAYLLLNCRVFSVGDQDAGFREDKDFAIWCGDGKGFLEVAIPVDLDLRMGETTRIDLVMESYCPWYSIRGNEPQKILVPITFEPTVDDWIDGGSINVGV